MCARFAELLAGSFNRFVLLIAHVYKLKSAVSWVAVAHRLVEGSGICIATSSSGVNSPVTVTPMPSRQRSVERPQTCASSPGRDAVTRTSESNGSADCAAARGGGRSRWNRTWQSPGEILLHRLHYAHSSRNGCKLRQGRCHISRAVPREALL